MEINNINFQHSSPGREDQSGANSAEEEEDQFENSLKAPLRKE